MVNFSEVLGWALLLVGVAAVPHAVASDGPSGRSPAETNPPVAPAVALPTPRTEGGMPLMDALRQRRSTREYSDRALDLQTLADLLWAAAGINRPQEGKRTAPSTRNWQAVDVYVCLAEGAYRYDPANHRLEAAAPGDLRDLTGMQDFVATAPVNLVYVADLTRMAGIEEEAQRAYSAADAAFMAENVYLFCASSGLATVVRGSVDGAALTGPLKLKEGQRVVLAQTVGYPAAP